MRDRTAALLLAVLATLAFLLFLLWHSDYVLKDKCLDAGGRWNGDARVCEIRADRAPASSASPPS